MKNFSSEIQKLSVNLYTLMMRSSLLKFALKNLEYVLDTSPNKIPDLKLRGYDPIHWEEFYGSLGRGNYDQVIENIAITFYIHWFRTAFENTVYVFSNYGLKEEVESQPWFKFSNIQNEALKNSKTYDLSSETIKQYLEEGDIIYDNIRITKALHGESLFFPEDTVFKVSEKIYQFVYRYEQQTKKDRVN